MNQVVGRVFRSDMDKLAAYWKPEVAEGSFPRDLPENTPQLAGTLEGSRPVFHVKKGIVDSPVALYSPDPTYTNSAHHKNVEGLAILKVIVNEKGFPEILEVIKEPGEGLGLEALETVSNWRFKPATKNEIPCR